HHQAAEALVRDEQVAPAAEQETREGQLGRGPQRPDQLVLCPRGQEPVRRTADPERGVVAKRLLLPQALAQARAQPVPDPWCPKSHAAQIALRAARGSTSARIPGGSAPSNARGPRRTAETRWTPTPSRGCA